MIIEDVLREVARSAYWYGEETGDYDMTLVHNEDWFQEAKERINALQEALEWYEEQTRLARLIHSEGDKGRNALAADGGKKARAALAGDKR